MKPRDLSDAARLAALAEEELLTPKEAAKFLKMSTSFLAKKRMHGGGPAYSKSGRSVRYSKAALLRWLKCHECSSTKDYVDDEAVKTAPSITPEIAD
jgi:Helix-turn-helix domain